MRPLQLVRNPAVSGPTTLCTFEQFAANLNAEFELRVIADSLLSPWHVHVRHLDDQRNEYWPGTTDVHASSTSIDKKREEPFGAI